jgi:hypothetical protein
MFHKNPNPDRGGLLFMDPPNPDQRYGLLSLPVIYKDREILFVILQTRDIYLIGF